MDLAARENRVNHGDIPSRGSAVSPDVQHVLRLDDGMDGSKCRTVLLAVRGDKVMVSCDEVFLAGCDHVVPFLACVQEE